MDKYSVGCSHLSSIHWPDAPYSPVSSTAATVSSEDAPVSLADGTARADEIDLCKT